MTILSKSLSVLRYTVQYACVAHCTFEYLGGFVVFFIDDTTCEGPSMLPTIKPDDIVITSRYRAITNTIQRNDIVIVKLMSIPGEQICKRIVGLEGDRINVSRPGQPNAYVFVPRGHVWLEGDNKENSIDSRAYGPVPAGLIRSKVLCKLWPKPESKLMEVSASSSAK